MCTWYPSPASAEGYLMGDTRCLITGCGRSGTRFISRVLQSLDYDMRHERTGRDGSACWYCCMLFEPNINHNTDVTRCGCQFENVVIDHDGAATTGYSDASLRDHYDLILHQLRSPMDVIASAQTLTDGSLAYIDNKIGIRRYDDRILQGARYWLEWNKAAYRICDFSYRIEDLWRQLPNICDLIGIPCTIPGNEEALRQQRNSRPHTAVSANHIKERDIDLYHDLVDTAEAFGYVI